MSWILVRVDDRLIHGQVVVAWGGRMRPARIWVADDAIAASEWERDLLISAAPDAEVRVTSIAEAAAAWPTEAAAAGGAFLLVRDLPGALALHQAGAAFERLNLGGLHYAPGKTKVNEYVYLDERDRTAARSLAARGVVLEAQDVPAARPEALAALDPGTAVP
jgi:mannose/fructose/N-acetylgalactosamine-specific phosphotransferase system component IIB